MQKLVISVAIIGNLTSRDQNPNVPITPKEIAESALESYDKGAAVCHIHVRDPQTQVYSNKFELYQEVFERIREKSDMIINLSTGIGGGLGYTPDSDNHWDTSKLMDPEERVYHILKLKPELCSLDVGTLNFGARAFVNLVQIVEKMAMLIKEVGTKPEIEVFDIGHIRIAKHLISQGLIADPPLFQLCLGIPWGIAATVENIVYMLNNLPNNPLWYAFGLGAQHFNMATASMIMGGHVRVGFEDNIYIRKNELAKSNGQMVQKVVDIAGRLDRQVATVKEAREILGLA